MTQSVVYIKKNLIAQTQSKIMSIKVEPPELRLSLRAISRGIKWKPINQREREKEKRNDLTNKPKQNKPRKTSNMI